MVSGLAMQGKPVALSWGATKAYCNSLILKPFQPDLCEAFRKLNLQVVPQGFLANLQVSPTLEDQIREAQLLDAMVHLHSAQPQPQADTLGQNDSRV